MDKDLKSIIYGLAIGDALGVPFEFISRNLMNLNPCKDMNGFGTHNQPIGSWSDDTSLTLCLLDAISYKNHIIDKKLVAQNMISWLDQAKFTANNIRFDVGFSTRRSIMKMKTHKNLSKCGDTSFNQNGNGALMRIAPLVLFLKDEQDIFNRFLLTKEYVSMTHGNEINIIGCHIYIEFMLQILKHKNMDKFEILNNTISILNEFYSNLENYLDYEDALSYEYLYNEHYKRIINKTIFQNRWKGLKQDYDIDIIKSSGFIVHSLEASIFCFMTTNNYKESVLLAVNLGEDTDTIAAITGSMSGLYYGIENIPKDWIDKLLNKSLINETIEKSLL